MKDSKEGQNILQKIPPAEAEAEILPNDLEVFGGRDGPSVA